MVVTNSKRIVHTAAVAVLDQDLERVLLIERHGAPFRGLLGLPGGRLQPGEGYASAAGRELLEETGLELSLLCTVGVFESDDYLMTVFAAIESSTTSIVRPVLWQSISAINESKLAPYVKEACERAQQAVAYFLLPSVAQEASIASADASAYLHSSMVTIEAGDGSIDSGWDHFISYQRVGTMGTAFGVLASVAAGDPVRGPRRQSLVSTLIRRANNPDGGWGVKGMEGIGAPSVVESTACVLQALLALGVEPDHQSVREAIGWLLAAQRRGGGWGLCKESTKSRTLPTSLALEALSAVKSPLVSASIVSGCSWLKGARYPEGSWGPVRSTGAAAQQKGTTAHTARAVLALLSCGETKNAETIRDGVEWLLQGGVQAWKDVAEVEYLPMKGADTQRLDFKHSGRALAMQAILRGGISACHPTVVGAAQRIVREKGGRRSWSHSLVPGTEPIWCMCDNLSALEAFRASTGKCLEEASRAAGATAITTVERLGEILADPLSGEATREIERLTQESRELAQGLDKGAASQARIFVAIVQGLLLAVVAGLVVAGTELFIEGWSIFEPVVFLVVAVTGAVGSVLGFRIDRYQIVNRARESLARRLRKVYGEKSE